MRRFLRRLLLVGCLGLVSGAQAALTNDLVFHWSFDDCTALDNSGNGHNGEINAVECVNGLMGKALRFDRLSSVVSTSLLKVKKTYSVAMSVRFKSTDVIENQLFYLSRKACNHRFGYLSTFPVGLNTWHWGSANYCIDEDAETYLKDWKSPRNGTEKDPRGLLTNKWYQLVFVLDDNHISLYIDGVLLHTVKAPYGSSIENYSDFIFSLGSGPEPNKHMNGEIDEVRFYDRALVADDVKALYALVDTAPLNSAPDNHNVLVAQNLDLTLPDIILDGPQNNTNRLSASLNYLGQDNTGAHLWGLKGYQFFNNKLPVANNRDSARLLSNFDIRIPFAERTVQNQSAVYWANLKYIGDNVDKFYWKTENYGDSALNTCHFGRNSELITNDFVLSQPTCLQLWDAWIYYKIGKAFLQNEFNLLSAQAAGSLTSKDITDQNVNTAQRLVDVLNVGSTQQNLPLLTQSFLELVAQYFPHYTLTDPAYVPLSNQVNATVIQAVFEATANSNGVNAYAGLTIDSGIFGQIQQSLSQYNLVTLNSKMNTLSLAIDFLSKYYQFGGDKKKVFDFYRCDVLSALPCEYSDTSYTPVLNKIITDLKLRNLWRDGDYDESQVIAIIENNTQKFIPDMTKFAVANFK